jgi:hypothetical protein
MTGTQNAFAERTTMRKAAKLGMFLSVVAGGCATHDRPPEYLPRRYDCAGTLVTSTRDTVQVDGRLASVVRMDADRDFYRLEGPGGIAEYAMPHDRLADASVIRGGDAAGQAICVADGGYTDAVRRFLMGATVVQVAQQLAVSAEEARERIGKGLYELRCRYHDEC